MLRAVALGLGLFVALSSNAAPSRDPSFKEFIQSCREHRLRPEGPWVAPPQVGSIAYFPTWALENNQGRASWAALKRKLPKHLDESGAYIDEKKDEWVFAHDQGRSLYPKERRLRGIYYRGAIHIVEGHHRALISTYINAPTVPVLIEDDRSAMEPDAFRQYMDQEKLSYFRNYRGQSVSEVDLCDMVDDPNLELARILVARVDVEYSDGRLEIENLRGRKRVIGVKRGDDISFLEFEVADALRRAGVEWDNDNARDIAKEKLEKYLEILKKAAKRPGSRLANVLLFDEPTKIRKLDLPEVIHRHLIKIGCEASLRSSP